MPRMKHLVAVRVASSLTLDSPATLEESMDRAVATKANACHLPSEATIPALVPGEDGGPNALTLNALSMLSCFLRDDTFRIRLRAVLFGRFV